MAAREAYQKKQGAEVEYHNVKQDPSAMQRMLQHSGGRRDVPVIVEGEKVTIGYGGS